LFEPWSLLSGTNCATHSTYALMNAGRLWQKTSLTFQLRSFCAHISRYSFAYIGSIGVLAQLPNFNKVFKKNNVEFEQHTAGAYKRTLTVFGENTDEGREKFQQEIEEIHTLFKDWVHEQRSEMDIEKVATGEFWPGIKAKELGLVDEIMTSDDYILSAHPDKQIYSVKYAHKKNVAEKLGMSFAKVAQRSLMRMWSESRSWFH